MLERLLNRFRKPTRYESGICVGGTYILGDGDPFRPVRVRVLDVKNGWVKYKYLAGPGWTSRRVRDFQSMYKLVEE